MAFIPTGITTDLAPGTMTGVEVAGEGVLLANVGGTFHAIARKCPHMGFDLCKGRLDGAAVICPMHGAAFDLATGEAVEKARLLFLRTRPKPTRVYRVRIDGDRISIDK